MEFILKLDPETETKLNRLLNWVETQNETTPTPEPESQLLFSVKSLADFLDCSSTTAQKLKNSGKIRYRQFGRKCVFNTVEILEDLKRKR